MRQKRNTIIWNIKDILASTRVSQMTLEEEGAYRRALDIFYLNGYLPYELSDLAKAIGKGCTLQVAEKVRSMFKPDSNTLNALTHDYLEKMPEGFEDDVLIVYDANDNKKQMFIKCCENLVNDEFIMFASPNCKNLDRHNFQHIVNEFMSYKLATGQYVKYRDSIEIRRNLLNFIPYSNTLKAINKNDKPYSNPKSATSKFEQW